MLLLFVLLYINFYYYYWFWNIRGIDYLVLKFFVNIRDWHAASIFQDTMIMELHSWGKTIQDIAECLEKVPILSLQLNQPVLLGTVTQLFLLLLLLLWSRGRLNPMGSRLVLPRSLNSHPTPSRVLVWTWDFLVEWYSSQLGVAFETCLNCYFQWYK